jgi:hypothetical protein
MYIFLLCKAELCQKTTASATPSLTLALVCACTSACSVPSTRLHGKGGCLAAVPQPLSQLHSTLHWYTVETCLTRGCSTAPSAASHSITQHTSPLTLSCVCTPYHALRWLQRDLESVERCDTQWLVLLLHRPMYVVYPHFQNRRIGEELREALVSAVGCCHLNATL